MRCVWVASAAILWVLYLVCVCSSSSVSLLHPLPAPSGIVDDCCCDVRTVSSFNEELQPILKELVKSTFFTYFKVNYLTECPFWAENYICQLPPDRTTGGCGVCECDDEEIPEPWKREEQKQRKKLEKVDTTIGEIEIWKEEEGDEWIIEDAADQAYINLQLNPERFTGYGGFNSTRIWLAIYNENCFPGPAEQQCLEERVFSRLISGYHASTTTHICAHYSFVNEKEVDEKGVTVAKWNPNMEFFINRLGKFPDRIKNVYFAFLFLLRAVNKASQYFLEYDYNTGHPEDDARARSMLEKFFSTKLFAECSPTFDENALFQGDKQVLKKEWMKKFRNISEIMDCVSCETCKIHAKLQILGLGTAIKILLASPQTFPTVLHNLQRNEIIALFNTLQKFSDSVNLINLMYKKAEDMRVEQIIYVIIGVVVATLSILFIALSVLSKKQPEQSAKKTPNNAKNKNKQL